MKNASYALCIGALIGATGGAALAHTRTASSAVSSPALPSSVDEWYAQLQASGARPEAESKAVLVNALATQNALRRGVIERYAGEANREARSLVREALVRLPGAGLTQDGLRLARAQNPVSRAAGFELLAGIEPTAVALAEAKRSLGSEQDHDALAGALMALRPTILPTAAEAKDFVERLRPLTMHNAPLVRAHAIQKIVEWSRGRDAEEAVVRGGLSDPESLVRQAAVGAVMLGQLQSEALKDGLVAILRDPAEEALTKAGALQALERFTLTDAEHATYIASRRRLESM
ncbi:hypothetical protein EON82_20450 [bacterium]|nr:MAG: hypothetical protein EON82_20450 [bacterium]